MVTFKPNSITPALHHRLRVGRPRIHWTERTLENTFHTATHNHAKRHLTSTTSYLPKRDWCAYDREFRGDQEFKWHPIPPPPRQTHNPPLTLPQAKTARKLLACRSLSISAVTPVGPGAFFFFMRTWIWLWISVIVGGAVLNVPGLREYFLLDCALLSLVLMRGCVDKPQWEEERYSATACACFLGGMAFPCWSVLAYGVGVNGFLVF